jgi:hypothetical protein
MRVMEMHIMAKKKTTPKKAEGMVAKKDKKAEPKPKEEKHEHVEECECGEPDELIAKNPSRASALKDLWFNSLTNVVDDEIAPEEGKREMFFLTLSNAILDMVMDIVPEEMADALAENIDDYLAVTLVNKTYGVDLLKEFQEEFMNAKGDSFEDDDQLRAALDDFQGAFWEAKRDDLKGKTPNQAVEEIHSKYGI